MQLFTAKFDLLDEIRFVSIGAGHQLSCLWAVHGLDISRLGSHFCLEPAILETVVGYEDFQTIEKRYLQPKVDKDFVAR